MKTALKLMVAGAVFVVASLAAASSAQAASLLKGFKVTPDVTQSGESTSHAFQFTTSTDTDLEEIYISYCIDPSGACGAAGQGVGSLTLSANGGDLDGTWTMTSHASAAVIILQHPGGVDAVTGSSPITFTLSPILNHALTNCDVASDSSSATCYVRVSTYGAINQTTLVDSGVATVTVVAETTITATVDPTFTFVIGGVDTGTVNSQITTSVSSTYSSLPFGNLTANTPRYAAQALTVTTNTQSGYTVTTEMRQTMTGVYGVGNNIDPFGASGIAWGTPGAWVQPVGTSASADTAWVGMNTTDTGVSGFSSPNGLFGPTNATANIVSTSSTSDPGNPIYVTYAVEANVYQPADQYTGTLQYTALPTY